MAFIEKQGRKMTSEPAVLLGFAPAGQTSQDWKLGSPPVMSVEDADTVNWSVRYANVMPLLSIIYRYELYRIGKGLFSPLPTF